MLKSILLLTPIYISLFWSVLLIVGAKKEEKPRRFLGVFMIFAFFVYLSHFLYFSNYSNAYYFFDPLYQLSLLIVFPLIYIYFRLLTVESEFSLKHHSKFLFLPVILFLFYTIGYVFADKETVIKWMYDSNKLTGEIYVDYLYYIRIIIKFGFIIQLLIIIYGNFSLIKKYNYQAGQYYSDIDDTSDKRIKFLNILLIITSATSTVIATLGRVYFLENLSGMIITSIIFSSMLFFTGWFGTIQKSLNPIENEYNTDIENQPEMFEENLNENQQKILDKILVLFNEEKFHLNSKLNIADVANQVGTNRTYLSALINQKYNYNFCTFVNEFRMKELEQLLKEKPNLPNQILCENCGFGSIDSMRRVILNRTGISFVAWRNKTTNSKNNIT